MKKSNLPDAATLTGTELMDLVQTLENVKATLNVIAAFVRNGASAAELAYLIGAEDNIQEQLDILAVLVDDLETNLNSTIAAFAQKQDILWNPLPGSSGSGIGLTFTSPKIMGTQVAPVTGNVSANLTGAVEGVMVRMLHRQPATPPTFDSGTMQVTSDSAAYVLDANNYIEFQYWGGSKVRYKITQ